MEIPKIKMPQIGGLDELKDKLGFGGNADRADDYDGYDDFDEFGEEYDDGFQRGYDDDYDGFSSSRNTRGSNSNSDYRDIEPIDASSSSRVRPAQADGYSGNRYSTGGYSGGYSSSPDLVSIDDVKAHTAATSGYGRTTSGSTGADGREAASYARRSYQSAYPNDSYDTAATSVRSRGYESLFSGSERPVASERPIQIIRPFSYEEVEKVAAALRRGDVVVLDLAATDQTLYKRILDFSFGAASMVNARVDCLASKIFSIQTGERLNSEEMDRLRSQGIL